MLDETMLIVENTPATQAEPEVPVQSESDENMPVKINTVHQHYNQTTYFLATATLHIPALHDVHVAAAGVALNVPALHC